MPDPNTVTDPRPAQQAAAQAAGATSALDGAESAIEISGVTHQYPTRKISRKEKKAAIARGDVDPPQHATGPALSDVTLSVRRGEIFGILGPNGSGKSTLFRILATLLRPTSGIVRVFGDDAVAQPAAVRNHLGVVFQSPSLDLKLKARENLMHQGHLYGLRGSDLQTRIDRALAQTQLASRADDLVERYSGGMRRKLEVAKALLHDPALLLLDEPSTGLDPVARRELWVRLADLRDSSGLTIVVSTHLMDEAEQCDRLAILDRGSLVTLGRPGDLKRALGGHVVTITLQADVSRSEAEAFCVSLGDALALRDAERPQCIDRRIVIASTAGPELVPRISQLLPAEAVGHISVGPPTLDDVFVQATGRSFE